MITVLMRNENLSIEQALSYVEAEFAGFVGTMQSSAAEIKSFGPEVDAAIRSYVRGIQQWVYGNVAWSLETERFFGGDHEEVKRTLMVKLESPKSTE